ncbi:MAG TPA: hypothetical protein VFW66_12930 [Gemmatimonadales bacterium]|nr:hypothetical protein [Gemmatimonadales bacterium]
MASAVEPRGEIDRTNVSHLVRCGIELGLIECVVVLLLSFITRFTAGTVESVLMAIVLIVGLGCVCGLPGTWTRAYTIEGIAGAAGIGLGAAFTFLLVDVSILQPIGTYTNRWLQIGGFANWWYHPVWWMLGTYLPWMGGWILANQTAKDGRPSIVRMTLSGIIFAVLFAIAAILIGFPGAVWRVPTFGVAFLPGIAAAAVYSGLGLRRR